MKTKTTINHMENSILYDWLTVSFATVDYRDLISVIGLVGVGWSESQTGSRLKYGHRLVFDGCSIHYTEEHDRKHNQGCCLEMSGQGCRDFETFGSGDWSALFEFVALAGGKITRLDVAYDDFTGVLPLRKMYDQADRYEFTTRKQKLLLTKSSEDAVPDHAGLSVCHGSKNSEVYIRVYDKRAERHAWEEVEHWIRFEVQLRDSSAAGFVIARGSIGEKFRGIVTQYLNYRDPVVDDSNKSRWPLSSWWSDFLEAAAALSVHTKHETEYNKDRLDCHVYDRNHNSIKTEILSDGLPAFLTKIFGHTEDMPQKYEKVLQASENAAEIQRILGQTSSGSQVLGVAQQIADYADAHGFNLGVI